MSVQCTFSRMPLGPKCWMLNAERWLNAVCPQRGGLTAKSCRKCSNLEGAKEDLELNRRTKPLNGPRAAPDALTSLVGFMAYSRRTASSNLPSDSELRARTPAQTRTRTLGSALDPESESPKAGKSLCASCLHAALECFLGKWRRLQLPSRAAWSGWDEVHLADHAAGKIFRGGGRGPPPTLTLTSTSTPTPTPTPFNACHLLSSIFWLSVYPAEGPLAVRLHFAGSCLFFGKNHDEYHHHPVVYICFRFVAFVFFLCSLKPKLVVF